MKLSKFYAKKQLKSNKITLHTCVIVDKFGGIDSIILNTVDSSGETEGISSRLNKIKKDENQKKNQI